MVGKDIVDDIMKNIPKSFQSFFCWIWLEKASGRWKDYTGTVNGNGEIIFAANQLPTRNDDIIVTVEGIGYHHAVGVTTYTINRSTNKIIFSNDRLNGLLYVVKIWR
jgi:hypothetical protein